MSGLNTFNVKPSISETIISEFFSMVWLLSDSADHNSLCRSTVPRGFKIVFVTPICPGKSIFYIKCFLVFLALLMSHIAQLVGITKNIADTIRTQTLIWTFKNGDDSAVPGKKGIL